MDAAPSLAERMRGYELASRVVLPARTYTIIRVDGCRFSAYTRRLTKPFDDALTDALDAAALALCGRVQGAAFAYASSDEISLLACDFAQENTQAFLGGRLDKIVSIGASTVTAAFNAARAAGGAEAHATFDGRAFVIPDPTEVANYFVWRQRDALRNAVNAVAETHLGRRALHGLNRVQRLEALTAAGVDFEDYPLRHRQGRLVTRQEFSARALDGRPVLRHRWAVTPATLFDVGGLRTLIPGAP